MIWAMIFLALLGWFALLAWLVRYVEAWAEPCTCDLVGITECPRHWHWVW